ncbi:hypothetical protein [Streptomyces sp. NPDC058872]|uniref:hypothetical protein n=1 Tax=Streptomyces sp. NPDC058872 TaxID=3346661 RepID=UPI0036C5F2EA
MEIVYASLMCRQAGEAPEASEAAEAVDAMWAHALPSVGLQHVSARPESGRLDFLLYLLSPGSPSAPSALSRAHTLLARSQQSSPLLNRRYLPPKPLAEPTTRSTR